jgi:hypothetical protein
MKNEILDEYKGKHISVIVKGLPHPTSGILEGVGESYIVINPKSARVEKVIIEISQIASLLVGKNELNEENKDERNYD